MEGTLCLRLNPTFIVLTILEHPRSISLNSRLHCKFRTRRNLSTYCTLMRLEATGVSRPSPSPRKALKAGRLSPSSGVASVTMRCPSSQASRAVFSCTRAASLVVSRIIIFSDVERMNDLAQATRPRKASFASPVSH